MHDSVKATSMQAVLHVYGLLSVDTDESRMQADHVLFVASRSRMA